MKFTARQIALILETPLGYSYDPECNKEPVKGERKKIQELYDKFYNKKNPSLEARMAWIEENIISEEYPPSMPW